MVPRKAAAALSSRVADGTAWLQACEDVLDQLYARGEVIEPPPVSRRLLHLRLEPIGGKSPKFSPEMRKRAVRMVQEHRGEYPLLWAAIESIAAKVSCVPQPERNSSLIHHSDRGSQYVSIRYSERLAEAGVESSVGSKGDSDDNALAETINGLYKAEVIDRRTCKTREAVKLATSSWLCWFNHHRLMEPWGYIPPTEAEANYYRQLVEQSACVT